MSDRITKEQRSENMRRIKSKNTRPEVIVRKYLFSKGLRFRIHVKSLPGKPDIVLNKYKTAIFINGCFWHGHKNCKYFKLPKTRTEWWRNKINNTKKRDLENSLKLKSLGWIVVEIFECEIKDEKLEVLFNYILKNKTL